MSRPPSIGNPSKQFSPFPTAPLVPPLGDFHQDFGPVEVSHRTGGTLQISPQWVATTGPGGPPEEISGETFGVDSGVIAIIHLIKTINKINVFCNMHIQLYTQ